MSHRTRPKTRRAGAERNTEEGDRAKENDQNPPAPDNKQHAEMAEEGENIASFVTSHAPPKLDGASNYRRWVKNMEMVLLRMKAWELTTQPLPPEAERNEAWKSVRK